MEKKLFYVTPITEIQPVQYEGVICFSNTGEGYGWE